MIRHHWTEDDDLIVRRDYDGHRASTEAIAARLNVTREAVKGRIQWLGLAKIIYNHWSPEEDERLAELIGKCNTKQISIKMHRSINSCMVRSKRLGLSSRARDDWYTKKEVCEILGVDHKWLQQRINSGSLKAHPHTDLYPQKNGGAVWHINESDLRNYIIKYNFELSGRHVDICSLINIISR